MPPLNSFEKTLIAVSLAQAATLPTAQAGLPATIDVNDTCTLQNAIRSANQDASIGGCQQGGGNDIIILPADSTISLTQAEVDGAQYGASGLPLVTSNITIQGNGSTVQRVTATDTGSDRFRILALEAGNSSANLTINSMTLRNGFAYDDSDGGYGGAIYAGTDTTLVWY